MFKAILAALSFGVPEPIAEGKATLGEKGKEFNGDWLLVRRYGGRTGVEFVLLAEVALVVVVWMVVGILGWLGRTAAAR